MKEEMTGEVVRVKGDKKPKEKEKKKKRESRGGIKETIIKQKGSRKKDKPGKVQKGGRRRQI